MLYAERHRPRGVGLAGAVHRTWAVAGKNDWQFSNPRIDTGMGPYECSSIIVDVYVPVINHLLPLLHDILHATLFTVYIVSRCIYIHLHEH